MIRSRLAKQHDLLARAEEQGACLAYQRHLTELGLSDTPARGRGDCRTIGTKRKAAAKHTLDMLRQDIAARRCA